MKTKWEIHECKSKILSESQYWFATCFEVNALEVKKLLFPSNFMFRIKYWKFKLTDLEDIFDLILEEKYQEAIYGFHVCMNRYKKIKKYQKWRIDTNAVSLIDKEFLFENLSQEFCNYRILEKGVRN
jgi:hypothetical protein